MLQVHEPLLLFPSSLLFSEPLSFNLLAMALQRALAFSITAALFLLHLTPASLLLDFTPASVVVIGIPTRWETDPDGYPRHDGGREQARVEMAVYSFGTGVLV